MRSSLHSYVSTNFTNMVVLITYIYIFLNIRNLSMDISFTLVISDFLALFDFKYFSKLFLSINNIH